MITTIVDSAFNLPSKKVTVQEIRNLYKAHIAKIMPSNFIMPKMNEVTLEEIEFVSSFNKEAPGDLITKSILEIFERQNLSGKDIDVIIDFSTTGKDSNGISVVYKVQASINAQQALTLAINNGSCASFHLALILAKSLLETHINYKNVLLISEDRVIGNRFQPGLHIVGDGSSAMLLSNNLSGNILTDTVFYSDGRFSNLIGINHWEVSNINIEGIIRRIGPLHFKILSDLINKMLKNNNMVLEDVELVIYQNMSKNDLDSLQKCFGFRNESMFKDGLIGHGHIFGSDLVINYHLSIKSGRITPNTKVLMISSGAGYSWGVSLVNGHQ